MAFDNQNFKSINARILNTERVYGKDSPIVKRIHDTIARAYKEPNLTRFKKYDAKKISFTDEIVIAHAYDLVNLSKYTSASGRKQMRQQWESTFKSNHAGWSDAQVGSAMDIFTNSNNWSRIRELVGDYGSDVILTVAVDLGDEDEDNSTSSELDKFLDAYLSNPNFSSTHNITTELIKYAQRDAKQRKAQIKRMERYVPRNRRKNNE